MATPKQKKAAAALQDALKAKNAASRAYHKALKAAQKAGIQLSFKRYDYSVGEYRSVDTYLVNKEAL